MFGKMGALRRHLLPCKGEEKEEPKGAKGAKRTKGAKNPKRMKGAKNPKSKKGGKGRGTKAR